VAYSAPPNFATGAVLTEAQLDSLSDDIAFLANPPKCRVYKSAALSVANSTSTRLTFDSELFDTDTMHSTSVNTGRITITTAGRYTFSANLDWAPNATGSRQAYFIINNATVIPGQAHAANQEAGYSTYQSPAFGPYTLSAGDWVELEVRQNSGGALNLTTCQFAALWVSL
jgi:hypothetical protein